MILSLHVERLRTPEQVRAFLDGSEPVDFNPVSRDEAYAFVSRTLTRFDYARLGKPDMGLVKGFLGKATGLSRAQLTRLVRQFAKTGQVVDRCGGGHARRLSGQPASVVVDQGPQVRIPEVLAIDFHGRRGAVILLRPGFNGGKSMLQLAPALEVESR